MIKEKTTQKQKILILAAIPNGLRLDREVREVEECIRRAIKRDMFDVDIRTAVRPQDIRRAIAEEKPQIVHFCGHGLSDGSLLLEDDGGYQKPVPPSGLASLFELHKDYPAFLTNFVTAVAENLMPSWFDPTRNQSQKTTHC